MANYFTNEKFISIHAPRIGSDDRGNAFVNVSSNFNPRSPYRERHGRPVAQGGRG